MMEKTDRPKVCVVSESTVGGVARQLALIGEEIPKRGFDLRMIVSCERDPEYERTVSAFKSVGIGVDVVPMRRQPSPLSDLRALARIKAILEETRPAVVHTHASKAGFLGRRAAWSLGIPCVHTPHLLAFEWATGVRRVAYRYLERLAAGWCDTILALSEGQRQGLTANAIGRPEMIRVLPNGVSCDVFHPPTRDERAVARKRFGIPNDAPVIGTAIRMEPQKAVADLLAAVALMCRETPDLAVLIAGSGSGMDACARRVQELGIADSVYFCGETPDMPAVYHALDCFMLTSRWEGLPYVVLEAMASGIPVVTTRSFDCNGLVIDDETGVTVPVGDVDGLAQGGMRIVTDAAYASALGHRARAVVEERFSQDGWADGLVAVYKELVQRK